MPAVPDLPVTEPVPGRLSVVMALFNRAGDLPGALDSITGQVDADVELVVVDGGSTDGSVEILRERSAQLAPWISEPDDGLFDAWNKGVARTTGEWIAFLGADDRFASPTSAAELLAASRGEPRPNLVVGRAALVNAEGLVGTKIGGPWSRAGMRRNMVVAHPACMTHRSLFERVGLFDPRLGLTADYEFLLRATPHVVAADVDRVVALFGDEGVSSTQRGKLLRQVRQVQAASPEIGPLRANVQFLGFQVALPARTLLRSVRSAAVRRRGASHASRARD